MARRGAAGQGFLDRRRVWGAVCLDCGPGLGVQTIGFTVCYSDALVPCTKFPGTDWLGPDVKIGFAVLSRKSSNGSLDDF